MSGTYHVLRTRREGVFVPSSIRPGDELAGRYRLEDLLDERDGGRFFRAWDRILARHVTVHVISADDPRAPALHEAARLSVGVQDPHVLRVLDVDERDGICFVVNEWGTGRSLDIILADEGPLSPRRAAWLVSEVAASLALAHDNGVTHGRLVPENVLVDLNGQVRLIGLAVDAAMHGLPAGRVSADLTDLAGNLYAALTGRWAGVSGSALPPAHLDGQRVLRPRRVRAGIPRELDHLCDDLLNGTSHRGEHTPTTAAELHEALRDFVGDGAGMADREAELAAAAPIQRPAPPAPPAQTTGERWQPGVPPVVSSTPPVDEEPTVAVPTTPHEPDPEPRTQVSPAVPADDNAPSDPTDVPTQAGMPVFHDDADDVGWVSRNPEKAPKPPPPPAFEEPAPRPLFAPVPEDGRPVRTPRPGSAAARREEHQPWDASQPGRIGTGTGAGSGSGVVPAYTDDEVPGRSWLRLAMVVGAVVLLLFAVAFAFDLGNGRGIVLGEDESPSGPDTSATGPVRALTGLSAEDFDPQGSPPREENPDTVGHVVDGDPSTTWTTLTYEENFGPGGLKSGVGVVLDLGEVRAPREVSVSLPEAGETSLSLYLTNESPTGIRGLSPIGSQTGSGTVDVTLDGQDRGRYLTVWLTSIPQTDDGRYRGEIAEIRVRA